MKQVKWLAVCLALLMMTACANQQGETPVTRQVIAMDTVMEFTLYGEGAGDIVQTAVEEIQRLEDLLSKTDPASEVSQLNERAGERVEASETLYALTAAACGYTTETEGCFDITVAPLVDAWGFTGENQRVPSSEELAALLPLVGSDRITLESGEDGDFITLDAGQSIDLGGIAKGYASDCLAALFAAQGAERGWVSLGGNVLAWGTRPDGDPWRVGIQDPQYPDQQQYVGLVGLENAFAVTSGGYQRYFEENGRTYHHILDPATGYPADSELISVTVVADADTAGGTGTTRPGSGTMCDAFSTALFVMGEERALDFWRGSQRDFDLILVTDDGRVLVTEGIADQFTPQEGSGYTYETVS